MREQNACIFTYKMNLGSFLYGKIHSRRLPAYRFYVFYASKLTWLGHVFLREAIFDQPYGAGGCRLIACACFYVSKCTWNSFYTHNMHSESNFVGKFTYKMDLGAFLYGKIHSRRLPAYKFYVFYASKLTWLGHAFGQGSHFLSTLRCGRLPAYRMYVFLRIKMDTEVILYVILRSEN